MGYEIPLAVAVSFVSIVFILYRLLVRINEQHISMLRDELQLRVKPEEELKEQYDVYQRKLDRLNTQLENTEFDREELEHEIADIRERMHETESALGDKAQTLEKLLSVYHRNQEYLKNRMSQLEDQYAISEDQRKSLADQYVALVEHIKEKFGENALVEFHYSDNLHLQLKKWREINAKAKHKAQA